MNKELDPAQPPLSHGSLFSGIGGFDLAAEWAGFENIFHCEIDKLGKQLLNYYWPNAISYDDITKTDFTIHRGKIDILTGGFPCQPFSVAGKRKGTKDDRHLWPEMLRAIREIQPSWIVGENVPGIINWDGGVVFEQVQADLENEGYEVWTNVLPAASVDAPHKRDRVWFVAYNTASNRRKRKGKSLKNENRKQGSKEAWKLEGGFEGFCSTRNAANSQSKWPRELPNKSKEERPQSSNELSGKQYRISDKDVKNSNSKRPQKPNISKESEKSEFNCRGYYENATNTNRERRHENDWIRKSKQFNKNGKINDWENFPTQPPICTGDDGLSAKLDGITISSWTRQSIKGAGNAIVPQVALQIFRAIIKYDLSKI